MTEFTTYRKHEEIFRKQFILKPFLKVAVFLNKSENCNYIVNVDFFAQLIRAKTTTKITKSRFHLLCEPKCDGFLFKMETLAFAAA